MITEPYKLYTNSYRNPTSNTDGYILLNSNTIKTETFSKQMLGVTIKARLNNIYIELSSNGSTFDNKILLEADAYSGDSISLSFACKAVRFSNEITTGEANGKYQLIGWCDE